VVFLTFWHEVLRARPCCREQAILPARLRILEAASRPGHASRMAVSASPGTPHNSLRLRPHRTSAKLGPCENYPTLRYAYWQQPSSLPEPRQRGSLRRQIPQLLRQRLARPLRRTIRLQRQNLPQLRSQLRSLPAKHKMRLRHRTAPQRRPLALRKRKVERRRGLQPAQRRSIMRRFLWC